MEEPLVLVSDEAGVRTLTLNRPKSLNSFTGGDARRARRRPRRRGGRLGGALRRPHRQRPRLLRRPGPGRSGGRARTSSPARKPTDVGATVERFYKPLALRVRSMPVPVIAAVNGVAAGAGANLALCCDLVIARALGQLHPGLRQDRPGARLRRHLAAAAAGRPRAGARPGDARRQAVRRRGGAARPDLEVRRRRGVRVRGPRRWPQRLVGDADPRPGGDARGDRRLAAARLRRGAEPRGGAADASSAARTTTSRASPRSWPSARRSSPTAEPMDAALSPPDARCRRRPHVRRRPRLARPRHDDHPPSATAPRR